MGSNLRRFNSAGKRKLAQKRVKKAWRISVLRAIVWTLLVSMALVFFAASFSSSFHIGPYLDDLAKIVLIFLAMGMVLISIQDKKEKIIESRRKSKLRRLLAKQKKTLENHFDLQKKLAINSSLNFVVNLEDTLEKEKFTIAEAPSSKKERAAAEECRPATPKTVPFSQINLAQTIIDGEDISSFPPEWQQFFIENEGKTPTEKLNKMLESSNYES